MESARARERMDREKQKKSSQPQRETRDMRRGFQKIRLACSSLPCSTFTMGTEGREACSFVFLARPPPSPPPQKKGKNKKRLSFFVVPLLTILFH
jgi:hypothetical protein